MKTKMPSEVSGSPSVGAEPALQEEAVLVGPGGGAGEVFWVITPRTSYRVDEVPLPDGRGERRAVGRAVLGVERLALHLADGQHGR